MPSKKRVWLWSFFALVAIVVTLALINVTRRPARFSPITVFPPGYKIPPQKAGIPERWISRNWSWYWRLKQRVFGPGKTVSIGAKVFEFNAGAPPADIVSSFGLGQGAVTNAGTLYIWMTNSPALQAAVRQRLENDPARGFRVTAAPRVTTGDAGHCRMMQSQRIPVGGAPVDVGVVLDLLPRIHGARTDLTLLLQVSELVTNSQGLEFPAQTNQAVSILTNLDVALGLQIPSGSGVLLLDTRASLNTGKGTGVFISIDTNSPGQNARTRVTRVIVPTSTSTSTKNQ